MASILLAAAGCNSRPEWKLVLDVDGSRVEMPLEVMDVFLFDDEMYTEVFEIRGENVRLSGELQEEAKVNHEEGWNALLGERVELGPVPYPRVLSGDALLKLPGTRLMPVTGGYFVIENISGKYAGIDGDITLHGRIDVSVQTDSGEKAYSGTIAVHGVSWG